MRTSGTKDFDALLESLSRAMVVRGIESARHGGVLIWLVSNELTSVSRLS